MNQQPVMCVLSIPGERVLLNTNGAGEFLHLRLGDTSSPYIGSTSY